MLKRLAAAASCAGLLLMLSACDDSSTGPSGGTSAYTGMWNFTIRLTAVGNVCGNSESEIGVPIGPVSVEVNAASRVVRAVPQGDGDGLYRYLAGRATEAAKWWRFQPARTKDGAAVSSNTTVSIVF